MSSYKQEKQKSEFYFFCILGLYPWNMEVARLGVKLELQLLAYTRATAMWDLSQVSAQGNAGSLTH